MFFGKHRGTAVEEIPDDYLKWIVNNILVADLPLRKALDREAEHRGLLRWPPGWGENTRADWVSVEMAANKSPEVTWSLTEEVTRRLSGRRGR